jgi:CxxC-x17-CxxC domain-containing protein
MPINEDRVTIFAETNFRNERKSFGIKRNDRRRHTYIIGKTGMGKTTLLENMIISDIVNGEGCCYIDPHGDTAEKLLDFIPANRINDVIYLNPADIDFPIAFNILESVDEKSKHLIASGLVGIFKKQFADSWGPRLEYILRNTILALLDYPGSTLLGIMRILVDKGYRKKVVEKVKDPVVRSFWTDEFTQWNERNLQEVISPIQNKVGQFLSNFLIRNIVGQVKSTINMREIIDGNKILILNLSKGRIGEDTMQLLGSMIVTKLYLAAMSRVDIPEEERKDFYLYVDEFQNFATDAFADILSEARKYRLDLIMAHQYIEQLPEEVTAAVFGNVGTLMSFRVGANDAAELVKEFAPIFAEEDLVNLPAFNIYLKLMIDGVSSDPFSAATLPPLFDEYKTDSGQKVINVSRERYANSREDVEDKINRWSGTSLSDNMVKAMGGNSKSRSGDNSHSSGNSSSSRPSSSNSKNSSSHSGHGGESHEEFVTNCVLCNAKTVLNFVPDGSRPIYCRDCLSKPKEERLKLMAKKGILIEEKQAPKEEKKTPAVEKDKVPAVSLKAALKTGSVNFSGKKIRTSQDKKQSPDPKATDQQAVQIKKQAPKEEKKTPAVEKDKVPTSQPLTPEANHDNSSQIQPGKVVKF